MKVLFIDNSTKQEFDKDLSLHHRIEATEYVVTDYLFEMYKETDRGALLDKLCSADVIISASSFCANSSIGIDTKKQMAILLTAIGRNDVKGKIYIDVNGNYLSEALNKILNDENHAKQHLNILRAISNNTIMCGNFQKGTYKKLVIVFTQYYPIVMEK